MFYTACAAKLLASVKKSWDTTLTRFTVTCVDNILIVQKSQMWILFILQMFWCWWRQGWRQTLRVTSARRRTTLWLPATNLSRTPCLAPPVGWTGLSLASVLPVNSEGAPAADTSPPGPLCSHHGPRARLDQLTTWSWTRKAGTAECPRQRPQAQVGLILLYNIVVKTKLVQSSQKWLKSQS